MTECKEPLGRLIYFTAQRMRNIAEKMLKPYDLTLEQFHLLKSMPTGKGTTQRELGIMVHKQPANMTRILDRLESKALVDRQGNPDDRRATLVVLTNRGEQLIAEVITVFESLSTRTFQGVTDKEKQSVRQAMETMARNMEQITEEG